MAKILLVEDDPMIAEIYMKKFEQAGFEMINATTGREALKFAQEQKFDLVLLDMVIPEVSGMDVLKEYKNNSVYDSDMKVIVFSNLHETDTEDQAVKNGADGFIGKMQYTPSELVEQIKHHLNEFAEQKKNKDLQNGETNKMTGKKILFIEDEEIFLEMFGKKLTDDGFEVVYAKNGAWGVKEALANNYDLIITDMVLPAMGGLEIVSKLKMDDKKKNIPIIVLSASVGNEEENKVKDMGIEEFFVKTRIVPSDLSRRVAQILNQ